MRRLFLPLWLLGCGTGNDDGGEVDVGGDVGGGPSQEAEDLEECRSPEIPECPPGFGFQFYGGAAHEGLTVVGLEAGIAVCDGGGWFFAEGSPDAGALIGVEVTQNSQCTFGCFVGCAVGGSCVAMRDDGGVCGVACGGVTDEEGCVALVRGCVGEEACAGGG